MTHGLGRLGAYRVPVIGLSTVQDWASICGLQTHWPQMVQPAQSAVMVHTAALAPVLLVLPLERGVRSPQPGQPAGAEVSTG